MEHTLCESHLNEDNAKLIGLFKDCCSEWQVRFKYGRWQGLVYEDGKFEGIYSFKDWDEVMESPRARRIIIGG